MVPERAKAVLEEVQLDVVMWLDQTEEVSGLQYDTVTGAAIVATKGRDGTSGRSYVVSSAGVLAEKRAWMSVPQALARASREARDGGDRRDGVDDRGRGAGHAGCGDLGGYSVGAGAEGTR